MTDKQLLAAAKKLYESRDIGYAPRWEQLGEVTRSVWVDMVKAAEAKKMAKKGKK